MRSMTGFGRGASDDGSVAVEVSSVNRKQLEIRFTLPRDLAGLEAELRPRLAAGISRGAVNVRLTLHENALAGGSGVIDMEYLTALVGDARQAAKRLDLKTDLGIADFLGLPGVITQGRFDLENPDFRLAVDAALDSALAGFNAMRQTEGKALAQDLARRLEHLKELLGALIPLTANLPEINRQRLLKKLEEANLAVVPTDERLLREVLYYADRGDTSEETTRLASHFDQFGSFLDDRPEAVGRSLDFLLQEMFREITTLGNKAPVPEVSPLVVEFKTELEKIREQVQNIE